jgi:hypothetical protein
MGGSSKQHEDDPVKIADVLRRTRSTLRQAELALEDLKRATDHERQIAAMRDAVVYGRAVTNVLQNLRSVVAGFDKWYWPWRAEMVRDPLLRYLYELRSEILKEGGNRIGGLTTYITSLRSEDLPPAPPNAISFFIGDQCGGIGWKVRLEDGTTQKVYVKLPPQNVRTWLSFRNLPNEHLGKPIHENSLENVCQLYLQYLQRLVSAAEKEFGGRISLAR